MAASRISRRAAPGLVLCLMLGSAPDAAALALFNRDAAAVRVTVINGADRTTHTVAPGATITDICARGCILKLEDGTEWLLDGSERVSIERSLVYYDGPERPPAAATPAVPAPGGQAPRAPIQR